MSIIWLYIGVGVLFCGTSIILGIFLLLSKREIKVIKGILDPILEGSPKTKVQLLRLDKEIVKAKTLKDAKMIRDRFVIESNITELGE